MEKSGKRVTLTRESKKGLKKLGMFVLVAAILSLTQSVVRAEMQIKLEEFLQNIQTASDEVSSFSSGFTQEKYLAMFTSPVIFEGKLAIIRPDKLRWEFLSPLPSVLVLNGDKGVRCSDKDSAEHFQLSTDPIMKMVAEQLWLWLGGDYSKLNILYNLEKKDDATLYILPKDEGTAEFIESVSIFFNSVSLQPERVEIAEPGGDLTVIRFINPVTNRTLPETLFTACSDAR